MFLIIAYQRINLDLSNKKKLNASHHIDFTVFILLYLLEIRTLYGKGFPMNAPPVC